MAPVMIGAGAGRARPAFGGSCGSGRAALERDVLHVVAERARPAEREARAGVVAEPVDRRRALVPAAFRAPVDVDDLAGEEPCAAEPLDDGADRVAVSRARLAHEAAEVDREPERPEHRASLQLLAR